MKLPLDKYDIDHDDLDENWAPNALEIWSRLPESERAIWLEGLRQRCPSVAETIEQLAPYRDKSDCLDHPASEFSVRLDFESNPDGPSTHASEACHRRDPSQE